LERSTPSAGHASLDKLYSFVLKHRAAKDALDLVRSARGKEYSRVCKEISDPIPSCQGFYLWGRYDKRRCWHSIYLGIAGFKEEKKNLKKRILEELKDERGFVWLHVFSKDELLEEVKGLYDKPHKWKRPILKEGATEIFWAPTPHFADAELKRIEADLIEALNPTANLSRPTPVSVLQSDTAAVFTQFREAIHAQRPAKPTALHRSVDARLSKANVD
jgi:hypothetical protein